MDVDKVPKSRWKLTCYICNQQMGACIQCGNKSCYQAFHVTCARRAKLFLRMKNSSGALDVLDGSTNLKALCDKHCPSEYAKENDVTRATKRAKKFYRKTMKDRIWANNQASAMVLAATHRQAITDHPPDESQMTGAKLSAVLGDSKKNQHGKPIWKLPSGAPVIPQAVFEIVEASLQRFAFLKRREFVSDACRYWTLKREMRRGAALLKRLQLQMETFSSMELTRRNFAAMGPSGKARLSRRIEFAEILIRDLEQLQAMSWDVVERERSKLEAAELEQDFVDTCYFPVHKTLPTIVEKAIMSVVTAGCYEVCTDLCFRLDKQLFREGLLRLQDRVDERVYTTVLAFAHDLCEVINVGINSEPEPQLHRSPKFETVVAPPVRADFSDIRDRKKLGKRILKSVQPQLEAGLRLETEVTGKSFDSLKQDLESMVDASLVLRQNTVFATADAEQSQDVIMVDSSNDMAVEADPVVDTIVESAPEQTDTVMDDAGGSEAAGDGNIEVKTSSLENDASADAPVADASAVGPGSEEMATSENGMVQTNGIKAAADTPLSTNGYVVASTSSQPAQPAPPTPPQSNGSFGRDQANVLVDGGIPWYLKGFEPEGTSALQEQWLGREAIRGLSEELTEMDEDELNGLGVDFGNEGTDTSSTNVHTVEASTHTPAKKPSRPRKRKTTYRRR